MSRESWDEVDYAVEAVIEQYPNHVTQIREDQTKVGWLVGQVMKAYNGRFHPQDVLGAIKRQLQ